MSLQTTPSRFSVLPDDVPEPIGKSKGNPANGEKAKKKKTGDVKGKADANTKKKPSAGKTKTLKSLAFGGTADGKKKGGHQNQPPFRGAGDQVLTTDLPHCSTSKSHPKGRPAEMTSAQWEEWQRRDNELVSGTYECELEAALVQSKLDYQNEVARRDAGKGQGKSKSKKKPAPVPLNEFHAMLLEPSGDPLTNGKDSKLNNGNLYVDESDDVLMERFRAEAKLELEREKQLAVERELISKRQTEGIYQHPNARNRTSEPKTDEKTLKIDNLTAENELLRSELESHKIRLKKVYDIFQGAQDLKDKAKLLFELENISKLNKDLNEQIQELHSLLEQERSKSHAAINECRKLMEQSRRRNNTDAST